MRIKELEDVLVLVDELPEAKQRTLVKVLTKVVDNYEAFIAEGVSEEEWGKIRDARLMADVEMLGKKLARIAKKRPG